MIGRFSRRRNDAALAERAQREGLALLSSCLVGRPSEVGLLLSFTNIPVEAAKRDLGWVPTTDMDTSIRRTIDFYVNQEGFGNRVAALTAI